MMLQLKPEVEEAVGPIKAPALLAVLEVMSKDQSARGWQNYCQLTGVLCELPKPQQEED